MLEKNTKFQKLQEAMMDQVFDDNLHNYFDELYPEDHIASTPVLPNQFFYIIDTVKSRCIYASPEVEYIVGYKPAEWTIDKILDSIHPDDKEFTEKAMVASYKAGQSGVIRLQEGLAASLVLNYRLRHKKGHFIHVLRYGSVIKTDKCNRMLYNKSLCTNISDYKMDNSMAVKIFNGNDILFEMRSDEPGIKLECLTKKERLIVDYLCENKTSEEIAKELCLSKHTIDTHRRNILKKLDINNTKELFF